MKTFVIPLALCVFFAALAPSAVAAPSNPQEYRYKTTYQGIEARVHITDSGFITSVEVEFWFAGRIFLGSESGVIPSSSIDPLVAQVAGLTHLVGPNPFEDWSDAACGAGVWYAWL